MDYQNNPDRNRLFENLQNSNGGEEQTKYIQELRTWVSNNPNDVDAITLLKGFEQQGTTQTSNLN